MQSRIIVKDFGPITFVDLDLRNVNVFIGPQASGKSALAKVYTIFKAPRKFLKLSSQNSIIDRTDFNIPFHEVLEEYNISSFVKPETEIQFDSVLHTISYKNGVIDYEPKLYNKIQNLIVLKKEFNKNKELIKQEIQELTNDFIFFDMKVLNILSKEGENEVWIQRLKSFIDLSEETLSQIIEIIKDIEINLSTNTALYIPAERNFINIIKNASLNLLNNNVPIPKHILTFGAELEKSIGKEINLDFLQKGLWYRSVNGEDRIFTNENSSIKLTEAASGIQSVLPILIPILFRKNFSEHRSFVIEEPELNLFPLAQYHLIKNLESNRREAYWEDYGTIHTYTTHSPYILSALNNLLYANKVRSSIRLKGEDEKKILKSKIESIVGAEINPYYFTAYQINNGMAESILNRDTGLIDANYIDMASDKMGDDFDALMELMDEYKEFV